MATRDPRPETLADAPAPAVPPPGGGGAPPEGGTEDVTIPTPVNITTTTEGDLASAAPTGAQLRTRPFLDAYNDLKKETDQFFLMPGNGYRGPRLLRTWGEYFCFKAGFIRDLPAISRPANFEQVPDAGRAVAKAIATLPEAGTMKVNPKELNHDLAVLDYWAQWQEAVDWMPPMIRLNRAHTEQKVATAVTRGLGRIEGVLPEDSVLRGMLGKAIKWLNLNAEKAQQTRRDHERLAQKLQGSGAETSPATGTGTETGTGTVGIPRTQTGGEGTGTPPGTPAPPALTGPARTSRAAKAKKR